MTSDDGFDQVIGEFLDAADNGQPPDRDEFLARHAGHERALRDFFQGLDEVDRRCAPIRDLAGIRWPPFKPGPFGKYELLEIIGEGGMGIVYLARHPDMSRPVALKAIRPDRIATAEDVNRFRIEVKAVASLDHPNIVPILSFDQHGGRHFFTMKRVEGGGLDEHLERFRGDPKAAVRLLIKVARAVDHAHQREILHRDLKPGNILLDGNDEPQLVDWGIAKRLDGGDGLTTKDSVIGTAEYMAPESGKKPLTQAADVYSLGVVLYELLTGRVPFRGSTALETLQLKTEREAPPLRSIDRRIDPVLDLICRKCLERNPDQRYGSAALLADDLTAWLEGRRDLPPWWILQWRWFQRNPAMAGLSGLALTLFALVGVATWQRFMETEIARVRKEARATELGYTAGAVADRMLMRIKDWAAAIVETANDRDLAGRLQAGEREVLRNFLQNTWTRIDDPARGFVPPGKTSPFESWFLFDDRGTMVAYPLERSLEGKDFSDREWFKGAIAQRGRRGLDSIHVSRVFQSVVTPNLYKFTLSTPVYASGALDAPVVGVVGASFTTDIDLGDERHKVVLAGPRDPASEGPHAAGDYLILMHPAHARGRAAMKAPIRGVEPDPHREQLRSMERKASVDLHYTDPLATRDPAYAGAWWAGLAPVGNTRFVAVVQRRPEEPAPGGAHFLGIALVLLLGVVAVILFRVQQGRSRR